MTQKNEDIKESTVHLEEDNSEEVEKVKSNDDTEVGYLSQEPIVPITGSYGSPEYIIPEVLHRHTENVLLARERGVKKPTLGDTLRKTFPTITVAKFMTWLEDPVLKKYYKQYKRLLTNWQVIEAENIILSSLTGGMRITETDQLHAAQKVLKDKTLDSNVGLTYKVDSEARNILSTGEIVLRIAELTNRSKQRNIIAEIPPNHNT